MRRILIIGIVALATALTAEAYTVGAKDSKEPAAQEVYSCAKTDETIVVDGKLDENAWANAPSMKFVDIVKGTDAFYRTEAKIVWDDERLYVGFRFEEPDIRGYWAMDDAHLPDDFILPPCKSPNPEWNRNECAIMRIDRFAKVFLDPDGDGSNYLEWHVNALNNVFDAWYEQGFIDGKWDDRDQFPHVAWKCPGFISATHIDGSINNPSDIDRGWSIEMSIPWESLKPFTRGCCPPKDGDIWGAHLGRVFRDRIGGKNTYWTWPCIGVVNCHLPDRYGKLVFSDKLPKFERLFAWSGIDNEDFVRKAADVGVTDLMCGNPPTPKLAELCAKHHIKLYPVVSLSFVGLNGRRNIPATSLSPLQVLSDCGEAVFWTRSAARHYQEDTPGT